MANTIMVHNIVEVYTKSKTVTRKRDGSKYEVIEIVAKDSRGQYTEFYMFCEEGVKMEVENE